MKLFAIGQTVTGTFYEPYTGETVTRTGILDSFLTSSIFGDLAVVDTTEHGDFGHCFVNVDTLKADQ
jgi:hypothetical protein